MNRTPGSAPAWANENTMHLIEDELPIWSRAFTPDSETFGVTLSTEDHMTSDGFDAIPDEILVQLPDTLYGPGPVGSLDPAEAVRLARALLEAAEAAGETTSLHTAH